MRVAILFFCTAIVACAQHDEQQIVAKRTITASSTPVVDLQPDWVPAPAAAWRPATVPGDTTPQGQPTEAALLRWVYRVAPDSFPDLPNAVRVALNTRQCQIPLPGPGRGNVITGAFTAKSATEWAVLCSVHDTSQILILNATNGAVVDSLNKSPDSNWIQSDGDNRWVFSRMIAVVPMSRLNIVPVDTTIEEVLYYGRFLPKPIDHDGIDEAFLDKASETLYFAQGRWFSVGSGD